MKQTFLSFEIWMKWFHQNPVEFKELIKLSGIADIAQRLYVVTSYSNVGSKTIQSKSIF